MSSFCVKLLSLSFLLSSFIAPALLSTSARADIVDQELWRVLGAEYGACNNDWADQHQLPAQIAANLSVENARLRLIKNFTPENPVLTQPDGNQLNLRNSFFLQYGSNVVTDMRNEVTDIAKLITGRWKSLWRAELERSIKVRMTLAQSKAWRKESEYVFDKIFPNMDVDGTPLYPITKRVLGDTVTYSELYNRILEINIARRVEGAKTDETFSVRELLAKASPLSQGEALTVELNLQQDWIDYTTKIYFEQLRELGSKVSENFGEDAARVAARKVPTGNKNVIATWYAYLSVNPYSITMPWFKGAPKIVQDMIAFLGTHFPLTGKNSDDVKLAAVLKKSNDLTTRTPEDWTAKLYSATGTEFNIKSSKLYSKFIKEVGTSILATSENFAKVNPSKPVIVLLHGDGTTRSSLASWRALLAFYESNGFNAVAIDMNELRVTEAQDVITLIDKTIRHIKNNYAQDNPIIVVGRSMGAQKAVTHAAMFNNADNVVDAYFAMSFSNPDTIGFQTESVYNQVKAGLFSGLIKESLTSASTISAQTKQMMEAALKADPHAFDEFGDELLFFQGDSDLDGGPTVVRDLYHWCKTKCPKATIQVFYQPEAQKELYRKLSAGEEARLPDGTKVDEDMLEGTHFIHSNRENNVVGAPRAQTLQSFAAMYLKLDSIADGVAPGKLWRSASMRKKQKELQGARAKTCKPGESYFEAYIREMSAKYPVLGLDLDKINNWRYPKPNTRDLNERFAYSKQFSDQRRAAVLAEYHAKGW